MTVEIREPVAGSARVKRPHLPAPGAPGARAMLRERLPGISEIRAQSSPVSTPRKRTDPGAADRALQHGWQSRPTIHGEVVTLKNGDDPDAVVPGLMAIGECCLRFGARREPSGLQLPASTSWSSAGRPAKRCAEIGGGGQSPDAPLPRDSSRATCPRPVSIGCGYADGGSEPTAERCALRNADG